MPSESFRKPFLSISTWGQNLALLATTLWVGSLWAIGGLAVPVLFKTLSDRMLAGLLAGKLFTLVAYVGMTSASYLLIYFVGKSGRQAFRHPAFPIVISMLALALGGEFALAPMIASIKALALPKDVMTSSLAGRFQVLHGIASTLYAVQCLLGVVLALKARRY